MENKVPQWFQNRFLPEEFQYKVYQAEMSNNEEMHKIILSVELDSFIDNVLFTKAGTACPPNCLCVTKSDTLNKKEYYKTKEEMNFNRKVAKIKTTMAKQKAWTRYLKHLQKQVEQDA